MQKWRLAFCGIVFFLCFFFYFSFSHPLYIYDTDDWTYIAASRVPWPTVSEWNPSKVLPEIVMPLVSEVGVDIINPIIGDYIESLKYIHAAFIALIITFYLLSYAILIRKYGINGWKEIIVLCIICLLHFLPYNISISQNQNLFFAGNLTHIYNYTIPGLLNAILVLIIMSLNIGTEENKEMSFLRLGLLLLFAYLCVNSNLFHSIVIASWSASAVLFAVFKRFIVKIKRTELRLNSSKLLRWGGIKSVGMPLFKFVRVYYIYFYILAIWIISAIYESNGGRAQWASEVSLLNLPIGETIHLLIDSIKMMRNEFKWILLITTALLSIGLIRRDKEEEKYIDYSVVMIVLSFLITLVYTIVICAKVGVGYISRASVQLSFMIFVIMFLTAGICYSSKKLKWADIVLPFLLFIMVSFVIVDGRTYADNTQVAVYSSATIKELDLNIINQVVEAEKRGENDVTVRVPKYNSSDNFPIATYGGSRISNTLFRHGITHKKMNISIFPDEEVNRQFGLE